MIKENAKHLIKEFEEVVKQEDVVAGKLKDYLYSRETNDMPFKDLVLNIHDIQSKKRQTHKKLRSINHNIH